MSEIPRLSRADVRLLAIHAQGLAGRPYALSPARAPRASLTRRIDAVGQTLEHLGAVQIDTISVLARNHELVPYARLGAVGRDAIEAAFWGIGADQAGDRRTAEDARTFEYWSHAACILPVDLWPLFAFRRRAYRRRGVRWHDVPTAALEGIRERLRDEGPLTTRELGGAKRSGEWWDWSESKIAIEWLLDVGDVVCVRRVGFRRVYDLVERAIPDEYRAETKRIGWIDVDGVLGPSDHACLRELVLRSIRSLGVGTIADIVDVHRLTTHSASRGDVMLAIRELADAGLLVGVDVDDWSGPVFADPDLLEKWGNSTLTGRSRTTLLSPFDSLVWHRGRTARVFGFDHRLEAYTPAAKREHGYFAMPVLHGGRLVARVDPKREGTTLVAKHVVYEVNQRGRVPVSTVAATMTALREAAIWVGCHDVHIARTTPPTPATPA